MNDELTEIDRATRELDRTVADGERVFRFVILPVLAMSLVILIVLSLA